MKQLLLLGWMVLALPALGQEATLRNLNQALSQAVAQSRSLDEQRRVLGARFQIMQAQTEDLLQGKGDLEALFRFYEATRAQAASAPLPKNLQTSWLQIQELMARLGQETNHSVSPPATEVPNGGVLTREHLQAARAAVAGVESALAGPPAGSDPRRYAQARDVLASLRLHLQRCLEEFKPGERPASYARLLQERRRYYVTRSALQLSTRQTAALDRALELLPR